MFKSSENYLTFDKQVAVTLILRVFVKFGNIRNIFVHNLYFLVAKNMFLNVRLLLKSSNVSQGL